MSDGRFSWTDDDTAAFSEALRKAILSGGNAADCESVGLVLCEAMADFNVHLRRAAEAAGGDGLRAQLQALHERDTAGLHRRINDLDRDRLSAIEAREAVEAKLAAVESENLSLTTEYVELRTKLAFCENLDELRAWAVSRDLAAAGERIDAAAGSARPQISGDSRACSISANGRHVFNRERIGGGCTICGKPAAVIASQRMDQQLSDDDMLESHATMEPVPWMVTQDELLPKGTWVQCDALGSLPAVAFAYIAEVEPSWPRPYLVNLPPHIPDGRAYYPREAVRPLTADAVHAFLAMRATPAETDGSDCG